MVECDEIQKLTLPVGTSWFQLVTLMGHIHPVRRVDSIDSDTDRGSTAFGSTGNTTITYAQLAALGEQQVQEQDAEVPSGETQGDASSQQPE